MSDLLHAHEWTETPSGYACTECDENRDPCNTCNRINHSHNRTCHPCIIKIKQRLERAHNAYLHIPDGQRVSSGIQAVRYDKHRSRTTGIHISNDPGEDDPDEIQTLHIANPNRHIIELMRDPTNVIQSLHDWADDWAETLDTQWDGNVFTWLKDHTIWAANNHPAWNDYLNDLNHVIRRFYAFAGLTPQPDRAPCVHCGGTIVQDWADKHGNPNNDGLQDLLRCTGCGLTWNDHAHLDPLKIQTIRSAPFKYPDTLVTLKEARAALRNIKRNTINQAISRDRKNDPRQIPEHGTNQRGETLYRLGDISRAVS